MTINRIKIGFIFLAIGIIIIFSCSSPLLELLEAPELSVIFNGAHVASGDSIRLDNLALGEAEEFELTITNEGQSNTLIFSDTDAMALRGALSQFTLPDLGVTELAPNESINLTLTFAPAGIEGDKELTIILKTNDENEGTFEFTIVGPAGIISIADPDAPTAILSSISNLVTNDSPIPVTLTFSERMIDFTLSMLTVHGATAESLTTTDETTYNYYLTNPQEGDVSVYLPSEKVPNVTGTLNNASNVLEFVFDNTSPTATLISNKGNYIGTEPFWITVTFSESALGLESSDFELTFDPNTVTGSIGTLNSSDGITYTGNVSFTPDTDPVVVTINLPEGVAVDEAGNPTESIFMPISIDYNDAYPTVTITSNSGKFVNTASTTITIDFSEQMDNFENGDIIVTNCTKSDFTIVDLNTGIYSFTANFSSTTTLENPATINIESGIAQAFIGDPFPNQAAETCEIVYDTEAPTGTMIVSSLTVNPDDGKYYTPMRTPTTTIELDLSAADNESSEEDLEIMISNNDDTFSTASWESFNSVDGSSWEIDATGGWDVDGAGASPPADIPVTIYYKFRDQGGNEMSADSVDVVITPDGIFGISVFAADTATGTETDVAVFQ